MVPLPATHTGDVGDWAIPHGLTSDPSTRAASPATSDTRLCWTNLPARSCPSALAGETASVRDVRATIAAEYPTDAVVRVADFYKGSNLVIGAKKRIAAFGPCWWSMASRP